MAAPALAPPDSPSSEPASKPEKKKRQCSGCGSFDHDLRKCPQRNSSATGAGSATPNVSAVAESRSRQPTKFGNIPRNHRLFSLLDILGLRKYGDGLSATNKFFRGFILEGELTKHVDNEQFQQLRDSEGNPVPFRFLCSEEYAELIATRVPLVAVDPGANGICTVTVTIYQPRGNGLFQQLTVSFRVKFSPTAASQQQLLEEDRALQSDLYKIAHAALSDQRLSTSKSADYQADCADLFYTVSTPMFAHSQSVEHQSNQVQLSRDDMSWHSTLANKILAAVDAVIKMSFYETAYNGAVTAWNTDHGTPASDDKDAWAGRANHADETATANIAGRAYPNPIIIFGAHGKSGNRIPQSGLPEYLARFFAVAMLHENNTSQVSLFLVAKFVAFSRPFTPSSSQACPRCFSKLLPYPLPAGSNDVFHKVCPHCTGYSQARAEKSDQPKIEDGNLVVEKNVTAALCLTRIFIFLLATGRKQEVFMTPLEVKELRRRKQTVR